MPGLLLIMAVTLTLGCKKFIEIDPPKDQIVNDKVYASDETASAAIRGIYAQMMTATGFASGYTNSVTLLAGRSGDDFTNFNGTVNYQQFANHTLSPDNTNLRAGLWTEPYKYIYFANLVLENLQRSNQVSAALKQQLEGEAKFIRAFCHFYLCNLFGNVPIILTTDYSANTLASPNSQDQLYTQMIKDLADASALLPESYPTADRIRANKWAATALLARVYLYQKDWSNAEKMATAVLDKTGTYQLLDDLGQVFLSNSKETILQFATPVSAGVNTREGQLFILTTAPGASTQVTISSSLLQAFDPTDLRLAKWVGSYANATGRWYFPAKYKVKTGNATVSEFSMVLRVAEQYLIRAEARAMQNNFDGTLKDLNKIRKRAGLTDLDLNNQADLLLAIAKERRLELFSEWGHRWLDLKRTGLQNANPFYPIPRPELLTNKNLIQNDGY